MTEAEVLSRDFRHSQSDFSDEDFRSISEMEAAGLDLGVTIYHMIGRMPFLDRLEL